jgi:osmotically-inducible protein OsmY
LEQQDASRELEGVMAPKVISQSDQALAIRLREALRAVDGMVIADVTNGIATLAGVVPSSAIAAEIAEIAARVEGVAAVKADRVAVGQPEPLDADDWPHIDAAQLEDRSARARGVAI